MFVGCGQARCVLIEDTHPIITHPIESAFTFHSNNTLFWISGNNQIRSASNHIMHSESDPCSERSDISRHASALNLPHELLDEILSYLQSDGEQDQQSLRNCSLVAKSWTNPCRRRLFEMVEIREAKLQSWLDNIPPANDGLLQHIRSLSYVTGAGEWALEGHRVNVLRDYFLSFRQLQHLTLSCMRIPSDLSEQVEIFSAFRHILSRLSVGYCSVATSALIALLNYFSKLDRLGLTYLLRDVDVKPAPPLSRLSMRELHISEFPFHQHALHIFEELPELGPLFDEIIVGGLQVPLSALSRTIGALGVNVRRLGLLQPLIVGTNIT